MTRREKLTVTIVILLMLALGLALGLAPEGIAAWAYPAIGVIVVSLVTVRAMVGALVYLRARKFTAGVLWIIVSCIFGLLAQ